MHVVRADLTVEVLNPPHVHPTEVRVSVNCCICADEVLCLSDELSHLGFILEPAGGRGGGGGGAGGGGGGGGGWWTSGVAGCVSTSLLTSQLEGKW